LTGSDRITYVKLHLRVVDMKTGEVIVADFMENKKEDRLNNKEMAALAKSQASQSDYGRPSTRSSKSGRDAAPKMKPSSFGSEPAASGGIFSKIKFWK
jgi:curli biogenesis system outer membrane secretion channel CsgG